MKIYSHSKLSTFEQCKLQYKFRYIDKIIPEIERSIEVHLGDSVHKALEWLYNEVKFEKVPMMDDLLIYYIRTWKENYMPQMVIVKEGMTDRDYLGRGVQFLIDYYKKNKPFKENTLETEKKIWINLDESGRYKIQGFIDRLALNLETGEYEIHDYKTNNSPPKEDHGEKDRQLALYAIAVKEQFGKEKEVSLIWHFLAHNKKLVSKRTNEQLKNLKEEIIKLIQEIESTTDFPPNKSPLCDWCQYKDVCPAWKKPFEKQEKL
ncbi:MAG TPA: PD-(D/E)XK nuclease family protein [Candidatus Pacearchaeota archaeon]|nr:PD-(D/E)XK nuclease family protein [Candidatus Pacearchaeota archaeon]